MNQYHRISVSFPCITVLQVVFPYFPLYILNELQNQHYFPVLLFLMDLQHFLYRFLTHFQTCFMFCRKWEYCDDITNFVQYSCRFIILSGWEVRQRLLTFRGLMTADQNNILSFITCSSGC